VAYKRLELPPEPLPEAIRFHLRLITTDSSGKQPVFLDLTNECIRSKLPTPLFSNKVAILAIPVPPAQQTSHSNFSVNLNFAVVNDSPRDGTFTDLEFSWASTKITTPATVDWLGAYPHDGFSDVVAFFPKWGSIKSLPHSDGCSIPQLRFDGINMDSFQSTCGEASFVIKQPGLDTAFSFIIQFISDTNLTAYVCERSLLGYNATTHEIPMAAPQRPP
jgi:hypothetical protein